MAKAKTPPQDTEIEDEDNGPVRIDSGLTNQQQKGAELAAAGWSGVHIAEELGVRPETVSRWRKLPAWQAEVDRILFQARAELGGRIIELSQVALDEIEKLLRYPHNASVRLRASVAMLQIAQAGRVMNAKKA
jgi:hypothetical protein